MTKLLKYPYLGYLWCMERIMWYRYRRAWAYAMTHPRDQDAIAEHDQLSDRHTYYLLKIEEVERDS